MTQAPPPYGTPAGYPPYQPPPPKKPRPSGWWFVLGGGLIVTGIVIGIALFVWALSSFLQTDARVTADGQTYVVTVGTDGDRMLWQDDGRFQSCTLLDTVTGEPIEVGPVLGSYSREDAGDDWSGIGTFDPGSGELEVTCDGGGTVLITPAPELGSFVAAILLTILIPLALGVLGTAVLITTGILWSIRPARRKN